MDRSKLDAIGGSALDREWQWILGVVKSASDFPWRERVFTLPERQFLEI
jgi:hypothetical protein